MDTSPDASEIQLLISKYSPIFTEIRKKIIFLGIYFALATGAGFLFNEQIIKFLINILSLKGINIVFTSPFQFINLAISCGIASGLLFSFPLVIYQIMAFLRPALRGKEYNLILWFIPFSILLFAGGFAFGFWIMKWQIAIFLDQTVSLGIGNILDISHLLSTVLITSALMGLGFQFPLVLLFLLRMGILKNAHVSKYRLWVYIGSIIFAILLPADSILADILLALPFIIMYEVILIINRLFK